MQNFLKSLFSNRFGLILAIANLVIIAFVQSGAATLLGMEEFKRIVFMANLPARIISVMFTAVVFDPQIAKMSFLSYYPLDNLILVFLQWLTIGWAAQKIARIFQQS